MKFVKPEGHPPLIYWHEIAWRWLATITAYLILSLAYSLISLAFQIPFSNSAAPSTDVANNANAYGKASFVVFWMLNWVGMTALGMACENVSMVIGQPWTAMWLIFWVISNVSTSFYEIALEPRFYYWGYAWPLRNSKSIVVFASGLIAADHYLQSSKLPERSFSTDILALDSTSVCYLFGAPSTQPFSSPVATSSAGRCSDRRRRRKNRKGNRGGI